MLEVPEGWQSLVHPDSVRVGGLIRNEQRTSIVVTHWFEPRISGLPLDF